MEQDEKELEILKLRVDAWKTTIETQQHFNDLAMKVRNFGILMISALLGAAGISLKYSDGTHLNGYDLSIASFFTGAAAIVWLLIYLVDVKWYQPLLIGSVKHGLNIEEELIKVLPEIGLTTSIKRESPVNIFPFKSVRSETKAKWFYAGVFLVLLAMTFLLQVLKPSAANESLKTDNIDDKTAICMSDHGIQANKVGIVTINQECKD